MKFLKDLQEGTIRLALIFLLGMGIIAALLTAMAIVFWLALLVKMSAELLVR